MKRTTYIASLFLVISLCAMSCGDSEDDRQDGSISLVFDNVVGDEDFILRGAGDQTYDFTDATGQDYNISNVGYYISGIQFTGQGNSYSDPQKITVDASKLTGFYHVLESDAASQLIKVDDVTAGQYDKVKFIVGVRFYTFIDGPAGGVLDPANGAWFQNMQSGYVNMAIEGNASNSGQEYVSTMGDQAEILEGTFSLRLSGWRDVEPEPGQSPIFVDNTRTIELDFGELITIEEGLDPEAHVKVDLAKILEGIDFSQTYNISSPTQGVPFASRFNEAYELDYVTQ